MRLVAPTWGLTLSKDTGTILGPDIWDGYFLVKLDAPALYDHGTGPPETLTELREAWDNMELLADDPA